MAAAPRISPAILLAVAAAFLSMALVFVSKTFADAIFLGEFGIGYVPHFYIAQAIGLISSSAAYGAAIRRGPSAPLDAVILIAFAASAALGPLAVRAGGGAVFAESLALTVLSTLASLAMWNAATAVVSGRKSRWFIPRAGAAATAGAVIGGFGASGVVAVLQVQALGPVIAGMALTTLVVRSLLVKRSSEWRPGRSLEEARGRALAARRKLRARRPLADAPPETRPHVRLVRILALATVVEAVLTAFVDFGFKQEVAAAFSNKDDIGFFFAVFYGVSNVVLLVLQLFASSRLLATRSLRFSLSLEPAALVAAAVTWAIFPVLMLGAVARGLESVMKFGVARPAQEVALTPLTETERKRWKVLLRGVYNQGGGAVAGLVLIAAAPLFAMHDALVPAATAAAAAVWLLLQQLGADRYIDTLGAALGLRRLSLRDQRDSSYIDRDALARLSELSGSGDELVARFGRELLTNVSQDARLLVPHIGKGPPAQRTALYRILATRPHRACAAPLRAAMAVEATGLSAAGAAAEIFAAAAACLDAIAALGDTSQVARARVMVEGTSPGDAALLTDPMRWSAWTYLARVGALDSGDDATAERQAVIDAALAHDGVRAAEILRAAVERGVIPVRDAELMAERAADQEEPERRRNGLFCCGALGWTRPIGRVIDAMSGREPWLDELIANLDARAVNELLSHESYRRAITRVRARVLRGLRSSDLPDVADLIARELLDPDPTVRELAARTLLRRARDHGDSLQHDLADRALALQLDRFEVYVRARPGYAATARESNIEVKYRSGSANELTQEAFFIDELERRTERSLSRVCAVLALFGNPSSVYAAERALRAPTFKRRRQALDILQEVARGRDRARLLELLEHYLLPPREVGPDARQRACDMDPWLARVAASSSEPTMQRLWALRATLLFDDIDGELLDALAVRANEIDLERGAIVVAEGDPGDALYVVMRGVVTVEREGKVVAQLGAGQAFGELALVDGLPRMATVKADARSRLLRLPRDTFDAALAEYPEIGLGLVRGLVRWMRQGDDAPRPEAYRR
jgi:hypothetical protein